MTKEAQQEFPLYEELLKQNEKVKAALEQRKADQHYGEIVGIEQVMLLWVSDMKK